MFVERSSEIYNTFVTIIKVALDSGILGMEF
jgi:hypothetical protein